MMSCVLHRLQIIIMKMMVLDVELNGEGINNNSFKVNIIKWCNTIKVLINIH
jgi:hypothetical protein